MEIRPGGLDVFYLDESGDEGVHVVTAVRVPFIRVVDGKTIFLWNDYLRAAEAWRRKLSHDHSIRFREEIHAVKLINSRDQYHKTRRNLTPDECFSAYSAALAGVDFLPENSILTVAATNATRLFGWRGVEAAFMALMQRLRTHCDSPQEKTNGMLFFDDGHDEYVRWFRRSCANLPTGSTQGGTQNLPLSMFTKDGNFKKSHFSYFVQIADLVSYGALQKLKNERGRLQEKRVRRGHHLLYDAAPAKTVNRFVTRSRGDGIALI